jgi:choline kinase
MQAIIMAAGYGRRIAKISKENPKSFLELNGEKLIERAVRLLKARGIEDITVVTGYRPELFHELLGDSVHFRHNPLYFCTNVLASFAVGMDKISDEFIFLHADTVFAEPILDRLISNSSAGIILPVDFKVCVEEEMKVILDDRGFVKEINKTMSLDVAVGEFIGMAKISSSMLDRLKGAVHQELEERHNHQEYFEAAVQNLIDDGVDVGVVPTGDDPWIEIDFPEDYERVKFLFPER